MSRQAVGNAAECYGMERLATVLVTGVAVVLAAAFAADLLASLAKGLP